MLSLSSETILMLGEKTRIVPKSYTYTHRYHVLGKKGRTKLKKKERIICV